MDDAPTGCAVVKFRKRPISFNRTDSGWDNPFRPDGDLSREADEIVELIKGGKPITPTPGSVAPKLPFVSEAADSAPSSPTALTAPTIQQSPPQRKVLGANGAAPCTEEKQPLNSAPAPVEVKRETVVPASDASQVEHVVLKKKPKCKCCVIQTGEPPSHSTPHPLPITMSRGTIASLEGGHEALSSNPGIPPNVNKGVHYAVPDTGKQERRNCQCLEDLVGAA
uniref:Uncharacterized protein n=1 Tax=Timema bartmani TaxID=61472 RepID=A0A7R9HZL6_9NEOP|nr:unnamed protein product [Timema bartmani]